MFLQQIYPPTILNSRKKRCKTVAFECGGATKAVWGYIFV